MRQRRDRARFALELRAAVGAVAGGRRQNLDRDIAPEPYVARAMDLAHPAGAEEAAQLERAEPVSGAQTNDGDASLDVLVGTWRTAQEPLRRRIGREQRRDLGEDLRIASTLLDECVAPIRWNVERGVKQAADALPVMRRRS